MSQVNALQTISLKNRIGVILIAVLCAALIISSVIGLRRLTSRSRNYDTTADGLTYLRELSSRDLSAIDATLAAQKKAHEDAEREQRLKELTDGSVDVWSYFTDYVFFGDSRAVGFSYYGFLAESRVIADSGWTIRDLEANLGDIIAMNPSSVYLAFGLNDIGLGYWSTPEEYADEFSTVLQSIKEKLPNASIYVNSILPTTDAAAEEHDDAWKEIPQYNEAIAKICPGLGCTYIDNTALVADHTDMYDLDGIHMIKDFYPLWAANMMLTIYGNGAPAATANKAADDAAATDGETGTDAADAAGTEAAEATGADGLETAGADASGTAGAQYGAGFVDMDGDGIPDENTYGIIDMDGDGIPDEGTGFVDMDGDGIPDEGTYGFIDMDGDGIPDDSSYGFVDMDGDGIPDEGTGFVDMDGDGIPDEGTYGFVDMDGDGIPD